LKKSISKIKWDEDQQLLKAKDEDNYVNQEYVEEDVSSINVEDDDLILQDLSELGLKDCIAKDQHLELFRM